LSFPTVLDLFAGAGGFGLGFKKANFQVKAALEIDKWACDTLRYNDPDLQVIQQDIREFRSAESIKNAVAFKPDVIIGGPPCQGFSISGSSQKDPKDPRNALFKDFARWVEVLEPNVFIMENVKGLLSRKNAENEKVIDIITKTFKDLGYAVNFWLLNSAEYGVPQIRERIFIIGTSSTCLPPPPKSNKLSKERISSLPLCGEENLLSAVTLWDAISDLPSLEAGQGSEEQPYNSEPQTDYQESIRGSLDTLYNHVAMKHTKRTVERFGYINWGESVSDVPQEYGPRKRNNNQEYSTKLYDQNNRRLHPYKPSYTIAAAFYANFIHPFQQRNLTAREGARVQSFPDTYRFMGKPTIPSQKLLAREGRHEDTHLCQYNQIGNAVPPLLSQKIAEYILKECF